MFVKQRRLSSQDVFAGYQALTRLYPYIPSLLLWRGWEFAAYRQYVLPEPALDVGCGDGRFFRLIWPDVKHVTGVDVDPRAAQAARQSGVYEDVRVAPAHRLPLESATFASAFANCSLEHMDDLPRVLSEIHRCLRADGVFVCSVITDTLIDWLAEAQATGEPSLRDTFVTYHHIANALSTEGWIDALQTAGFQISECTPIVPKKTGQLFALLDALWHGKTSDGEIGDVVYRYLRSYPQFPTIFGDVLQYLLQAEQDEAHYGGVVFLARKSSI
jgi:SAM-dependent methyltransferase